MLAAALSAAFALAGAVSAHAQADAPALSAAARTQPTTDTIVAAALLPKRAPEFRAPFLLNSHAPMAPVTNVYGGPEVEQNVSAATNGAGQWVAVWHSSGTVRGTRGRDYELVPKEILWSRLFPLTDGPTNWEGMALGPTLGDGSRSLLLISDNDTLPSAIWALRLSIRPNPGPAASAP